MIAASVIYLLAGILGLAPLELSTVAWNNIRIVAGVAIAGCLMVAIGYWDE